MPTRRRLAQRALALALSLFIALLLMEIALRVGFPAQTKFYVWPPHTKKVLQASSEHIPGVSGPAKFTVSAVGTRGPELGPDTEHRILAIGGSTTECLYLDDGETWTARLGESLDKTPDGRGVWVGNAGKSGMYSRDHVLHIKHLTPQFSKLDTALVLVGVNDVTHTLAQEPWVEPAPITDPVAEAKQIRRAFGIAPGRLQDVAIDDLTLGAAAFYKRTAVYQLVKRTRAGLASHAGALAQDDSGAVYATWRAHRKQAKKLRDKLPDLTGPLAEYRRNLELIADIAAQRSLRLVFLTQPTLYRVDLTREDAGLLWLGGVGDFQSEPGHEYYSVPALAEAMTRYNAVTLDVCRIKKLPCLDLAAKIPKDTSNFYDDCHFTEAGARAVAQALTTHLRTLPPFAP